ncbi:hypothetical protein [Vibrio breoganii]|uniref:hypothetical protein n=1 Tax=Vibrio breoganii TaxID=553239 RepID=UPI0039A513DD
MRYVLLTSYGFLQTLPLANNALASRVIFPSVGVIQVSLNLTGLPASLGKQKSRHGNVNADRFKILNDPLKAS